MSEYKLWSEINQEDQQLFRLIMGNEVKMAETIFASRFNGKYDNALIDRKDELRYDFNEEQATLLEQFVLGGNWCGFESYHWDVFTPEVTYVSAEYVDIIDSYPEEFKSRCVFTFHPKLEDDIETMINQIEKVVKGNYQFEVNFKGRLSQSNKNTFVSEWQESQKHINNLITRLNLK